MFAVQVRTGLSHRNVKLLFVGVAPGIGHGQNPTTLDVLETIIEFVGKAIGSPQTSILCRFAAIATGLFFQLFSATLNHKIKYQPMKDRAIVFLLGTETQEVTARSRNNVAVKFE